MGKSKFNFVCMELQWYEPPRSDQSRQVLCLLYKEIIRNNWQTKEVWVWHEQINEEIPRFAHTVFLLLNSLSRAIQMSSTVQVQAGHSSHGELITCLWGSRKRSEWPSCTDRFLVTSVQNNLSEWDVLEWLSLNPIKRYLGMAGSGGYFTSRKKRYTVWMEAYVMRSNRYRIAYTHMHMHKHSFIQNLYDWISDKKETANSRDVLLEIVSWYKWSFSRILKDG